MIDPFCGIPAWQAVLAWASIALPLALALALMRPSFRNALALRLAAGASLPALVLSLSVLFNPSAVLDLQVPWMLLGLRLGLDDLSRVFLLFSSVIWTVSGWYALTYLERDPLAFRFFIFHLLSLCGNMGLILAADMAGFYLFFALMTFSAYGLIVHQGTPFARLAGKIYIVLAVVGEALVIPALLLLASFSGNTDLSGAGRVAAASPLSGWIVFLILAGFGIKAGALPLHVWLPLAHPAAPTPASAILSGVMIKAGLLGWLRFLPLGEAGFSVWGSWILLVGLAGVFYGVLAGLAQTDPKTVLAYSSVSQMGFLAAALGIGLADPAAWPQSLAALLVYGFHHAMSKGALFLGVGVTASAQERWKRLLAAGAMLLPAASLAGLPPTGGFFAKALLKNAAFLAPDPLAGWIQALLPLAAAGTALLMGHFLLLAAAPPERKISGGGAGLWLPWLALLIPAGGAAWFIPWQFPSGSPSVLFSSASLLAGIAPVLGGIIALAAARHWGLFPPGGKLSIPPGDLLWLGAAPWKHMQSRKDWELRTSLAERSRALAQRLRSPAGPFSSFLAGLADLEKILGHWTAVGFCLVFLGILFYLCLAFYSAAAIVDELVKGR